MTTVVLSFGLVEDSSVGVVLLSNLKSFDSFNDVKESLGVYFTHMFLELKLNTTIPQLECSLDHKNIITPHCANCGARIIEELPSILQMETWLHDLPGLALHQFPPFEDDTGWSLEYTEGDVIDYVITETDVVIANTILNLYPDKFEDDR